MSLQILLPTPLSKLCSPRRAILAFHNRCNFSHSPMQLLPRAQCALRSALQLDRPADLPLSTALNQSLSPLLRLPPHLRYKILAFALSGHRIRVYALDGKTLPRVCPECYFGLSYAVNLGPAIPLNVLLAPSHVSRQIYLEAQGLVLAQNEFRGYPTPLSAFFKGMAPWQVDLVRTVTVSVLLPFQTLEDGRTVTGLSGEVVEVLRVLCGMRGLKRVSVEWEGKHDNHGAAHHYFETRVSEIFVQHGRQDVTSIVPVSGMKPQGTGIGVLR